MGFIKALKKRKQKNKARKAALKDAIKQSKNPALKEASKQSRSPVDNGPESPQSTASTQLSTPAKCEITDRSVDFLDTETHECNESIQLSLNFQDSMKIASTTTTLTPPNAPSKPDLDKVRKLAKQDEIIDAVNIEATLSEIKSHAGEDGEESVSSEEESQSISGDSDNSLNYLWRYLTCFAPPAAFDDESIFTLESDSANTDKKDLKSIKESEDTEDASEDTDETPTKNNTASNGENKENEIDIVPRKLFVM